LSISATTRQRFRPPTTTMPSWKRKERADVSGIVRTPGEES
jgi:hypothetical protein